MIKADPLWVNRFAPQTIDDCVLPKRIKDVFKQFLKDGHFPSLLLAGTQGSGKCLDYNTLISLKVDVETFDLLNRFIESKATGAGNENNTYRKGDL